MPETGKGKGEREGGDKTRNNATWLSGAQRKKAEQWMTNASLRWMTRSRF